MKSLTKFLFLLILGSCAINVETLQKPNTDFSKYQSWCWMEGCEPYQGPDEYFNRQVMDEISNAIASSLHTKGYIQSDEESDLIVNFYVILKEDSTSSSSNYQQGFSDDNRIERLYPEYHQFIKGTLVIDILNRDSNELLWTSKATSYFEPYPSINKDEISKGVQKTMKKLPSVK